MSSTIDVFPGIRLANDSCGGGGSSGEYERGRALISAVLSKIAAVGITDLVLKTHQAPKATRMTHAQLVNSTVATLQSVTAESAGRGVLVHIRQSDASPTGKTFAATVNLVQLVNTRLTLDHGGHGQQQPPSCFLAPATAWVIDDGREVVVSVAVRMLREGSARLLLVSTTTAHPLYPQRPLSATGTIAAGLDGSGQTNATRTAQVRENLRTLVTSAQAAGRGVVLDAAFGSVDDEQLDMLYLDEVAL
jgi:hypothetical protein